ncbi:MAG: extracellular solute-binding protein [Bifidobacteriaceae bacterium]|jgi:multiple sugar transport system substrate-binding protein|nr:extracellular solute-binding protein [Bifidobacteriaceae bacterium]
MSNTILTRPFERHFRRGAARLSCAAVAAALTVAGCSTGGGSGGGSGGGGGGSDGEVQTITTLSLYSADSGAGKWLESVSESFTAATGIAVKNEFVAQNDLPTTYGKQVIAGTEPDLVMTNLVADPTTWLENGATVDVAGYLDEWGLRDVFSDNALEAWTNAKGQVQAFPLEGYNWPMWYNMDLLNAAGIDRPPATWDELKSAAVALRDSGVQPMVVAAADYPAPAVVTLVALAMMSEAAVAELFDNGDWAGPDGQKIVQAMLELKQAGVFADDSAGLTYPDQVAAFGAGQAAMLFDGSWGYGNAQATFPDLNIELGGFPLSPDCPADKPITFAGQSTGIWISPNGQEKIDALEKFITHVYSPENLAAYVNTGFISPAKPGYLTLDDTTLPPLNVASQEILPLQTTVYQPTYNALSPTVTSAFFRASTEAFVDGTTAAQLTQSLEQAWQAQ